MNHSHPVLAGGLLSPEWELCARARLKANRKPRNGYTAVLGAKRRSGRAMHGSAFRAIWAAFSERWQTTRRLRSLLSFSAWRYSEAHQIKPWGKSTKRGLRRPAIISSEMLDLASAMMIHDVDFPGRASTSNKRSQHLLNFRSIRNRQVTSRQASSTWGMKILNWPPWSVTSLEGYI